MKSLLDDCNSIAIGADVSKEDNCIKLIAETVKHFVRIDILINNARVQEDIPLTENTFRRMVQNNRRRSYRTFYL